MLYFPKYFLINIFVSFPTSGNMCPPLGIYPIYDLPIHSEFIAQRRDLRERKLAKTSTLYSMNTSQEKAVQAILHGHSCAKRLKLRLDHPMANDRSVSNYDLAKSIVHCFSSAISIFSDTPKSEDGLFSHLSSMDSSSSPPLPQRSHSKKRYQLLV